MTRHILIVDDEPAICKLMSEFLRVYEGIETHTAENGKVAVDMYAQLVDNGATPDIVLMDIRIPVMDGITATKKILEQDPSANIYILTAYAEPNLITEAMDAGAKDVINKIEGFPKIAEMVCGLLASTQ